MSNENHHFWTLFSTSFKLKNNNHTKATKYKGFSELLFTFQPFPSQPSICLSVQSFRLLSRATAHSPDLLSIHSPNLLPACSPLSFFRLLNKKYARPARRPRTYPARALARCPRLCRLSKRSSHMARGSRSAIPRRWKSVSRMPRKEWYNG